MKKKFTIGVVSSLLLVGCAGTMPDLGINNGQLTPCPETPNCVNSQAVDDKHYIQSIDYTGTKQKERSRLLQVLESEDQAKILTARKNYIRAEFKSGFFGFVDDVEFYFPEEQTGETVIHIRSASRIGYSDFGVNRKRIERVQSKLKQAQ
jgi:uncharacterized protein (DUF1499 family)